MAKDTRAQLVTAAAELLDKGGPAAVTLREVGKLAGVSHNAPYKHFSDKEELLAAVACRELKRQTKTMNTALALRDSREILRALMHNYVRWATAHPDRFKLTFGSWKKPNAELDAAANE